MGSEMCIRDRKTMQKILRVRRGIIKRLLRLFTTRGFYRPDHGEECRHFYYESCEILADSEIDDLFPQDDIPSDFNYQDYDEPSDSSGVDRQLFVDWITEGQHDCDVARSLGAAWSKNLCGVGCDSLGEFFECLFVEYQEYLAAEDADTKDFADAADVLPLSWLAKVVHRLFAPLSFAVVPKLMKTLMLHSRRKLTGKYVLCTDTLVPCAPLEP